MDYTVAIRASILERPYEFVSVDEGNTAPILQPAINYTPSVARILHDALLYLKKVAASILNLPISIGLISYELALVKAAIHKSHFASANPLVILPLPLKHFAVRVITNTEAVSSMV